MKPNTKVKTNQMIGAAFGEEDTIESFVGFRGFSVNKDLHLCSTRNPNVVYLPEQGATAVCDLRFGLTALARVLFPRLGRHDAPDPNCNCGLYSYYKPQTKFYGYIKSIVVSWGPTHVHSTGWRSKNIKIIGFIKPANTKDDNLYEYLSRKYKVPLVPEDKAIDFASEHGHVVTDKEIANWMKEFSAEYHKGAIRSSFLFAFWVAVYFTALIFSFILVPVPIWYVVVALVVYWHAPIKVAEHLRTIISYRERDLL